MNNSNGPDILEALEYIDPAELNYSDWVTVGMALKEAGYSSDDWERWSLRDPARYHRGECGKKWNSFDAGNSATPVTGGTVIKMARDRGYLPQRSDSGGGYAIGWDDIIGEDKEPGVIVDASWLEGIEITEPAEWEPERHLIRYLETLFDADENVGYVTESWTKEGDSKPLPTKGFWDRTAGQLIQQLSACNGDIGSVLGDYNPAAGAWIRFNPLDGKGCKNSNVTDFRYALVESDTMDISQQNRLIRELELPVAALVWSGGKSVHAIVKIEAGDYTEYRKRVDYLYSILKRNGLEVDTQNKNPSRLSRMPGVTRNGHKQFLIDTNIGKASFTEWKDWIESATDDLPDTEALADVWDKLPELSPPLIENVLRQGHKMLLAGPSKAGKSFALIELCIAIAEGAKWLKQWQCAQGRVMYVNLELDRASCLHRFRDVYTALGQAPRNTRNIDIWNLRGHSCPMDKLAPKLIRRALKKSYTAIIIDPIYKIITGDENSADQMAAFCNQFDRVCTELGAAVIYCHHHSKGAQGQKRSMDRASGSGVFARDPDALLDLIELDVPDSVYEAEEDKAEIKVCIDTLNRYSANWRDYVGQDDQYSAYQMREACRKYLTPDIFNDMITASKAARDGARQRTAWRLEGTLREFPHFEPVSFWFDYPNHIPDDSGILQDLSAGSEILSWQRATSKRKEKAEKKAADNAAEFEEAISNANFGEPPTVKQISEYLSNNDKQISARTIRNWVKKYGYKIDKNSGAVTKKEAEDEEQRQR